MRQNSAGQLAFSNRRLFSSFFCAACLVFVLIAFATFPATNAQTRARPESDILSVTPPSGATPSPSPCGQMTLLSEGFETGNLHTFVSSTVPTGGPGWSAVNTAVHEGSFSAFVPDINSTSDQRLTLYGGIPIPAASTNATLTFWHRFAFEGVEDNYYDGGVLETSIDDGASWQDAGSNITSGGYNATISSNFGNPLSGRMAWGQNPNGTNFVQVTVNLLPYAGQNLLFRFREGTDSSISATGWWVDDIAVDITLPCGPPTPTPTATASPTPPSAHALNISTRLQVQTGNNVLIAGFIVTGSDTETVVIRGIGPSLTAFGVAGALADPTLELRGSNGSLIMQNDNWQDNPVTGTQLTSLGLAPQDPHESAILTALAPESSYTAVLAGANDGTGVGLIEVYDVNQAVTSELANISTRGLVLTGSDVMIGGFILGGANNTQVAVRGLGPSLAAFGLSPVLANPTLELHDSNGATLVANDNWQDDPTQATLLTDHGLALPDVHESGILQSLPPGAFTAILAGDNGGTGIGLIEIYNLH